MLAPPTCAPAWAPSQLICGPRCRPARSSASTSTRTPSPAARRNGVCVLVGDLDLPLRPDRTFDVVTAVPPYVPTGDLRFLPADVKRFEPRAALDGGADGLDVARRVVAAAGRLLHPGGWLLMELGGEQDELLATDLASSGFGDVEPWRDHDGDLRGMAARLVL